MSLFIDMDGVLADFEQGYVDKIGAWPGTRRVQQDNLNWQKVRETPGFFADLPPMPGALQLWNFAKRQGAYILTGCPDRSPEVATQKWQWARKHLGEAPVITCSSKDKRLFCRKGDVLVDDWEKYMPLWTAAGGIWITHKDSTSTILALRELGYD